MHVVFRESHGLDETDTPQDLGQTPADLVALSFSDSDLGAFSAGWHRANGKLPSLRLANLVALKHPLSVDTYAEQTLEGVKGILVNIFGGIMRCDVIAEGVVAAVKEVGLQVPLVVRLEGTNVEQGKEIINSSGLDVIAADDLKDGAQKIVKAVQG